MGFPPSQRDLRSRQGSQARGILRLRLRRTASGGAVLGVLADVTMAVTVDSPQWCRGRDQARFNECGLGLGLGLWSVERDRGRSIGIYNQPTPVTVASIHVRITLYILSICQHGLWPCASQSCHWIISKPVAKWEDRYASACKAYMYTKTSSTAERTPTYKGVMTFDKWCYS